MKLVTFMAKACYYAQSHIDCEVAWGKDESQREEYLQCTSMQMACFLAQNTRLGGDGVEWEVVLDKLVEHPMKSEKQWEKILNQKAKELGGWKGGAK